MVSHMSRLDESPTGKSRRTFLRGAGVAGAVALAGCSGNGGSSGGSGGDGGSSGGSGGSGDTETQDGGTSGGSKSDTVTLGALYPLTGPYGGLAKTMKQGVNLAVKQLNDNGGINGKTVEAIGEDTQASPQTGKQKARKLVEQDGVDALFGCISSAVGSAVAGYAEQVNKPYYPAVAADSVTMDNCKRTTFRYEARASQVATAAAPWAVDKFGTNVWIHNADYLWGNSVAKAWEKEAKKAGDTTVVGHTTSKLGSTDFSSYISKIMASDAEWVLTGLNGGDAVNFLKQATSYGLKKEKTLVSPVNSFQFIRQAAGSAAQNTYAAIRYYEGYDTDANKQFVGNYKDANGSPPDNFANVGFTYVKMYAMAAEEAGSVEADAIIDAQTGVSFDSPMGTASYRECDHQAARPMSVGKIVAPTNYDWPSIDVLKTISAEEATLPCSAVSCDF